MDAISQEPQPDWDPRSDTVLSDPIKIYDAMRRHCPVAYSDYLGWSLFRHEDVVRALDDHRTFSSVVSRHLSVPSGMDPPAAHRVPAADRAPLRAGACRSL